MPVGSEEQLARAKAENELAWRLLNATGISDLVSHDAAPLEQLAEVAQQCAAAIEASGALPAMDAVGEAFENLKCALAAVGRWPLSSLNERASER